MHRTARPRRGQRPASGSKVTRFTRTVLAAVVALVAVGVGAPPASAAPGDEFTFVGHGWGHGRGMGQYGALGYAVDHGWDYTRILDHFYGGTTLGTAPDSVIDVELLSHGASWVIVAGNDLRVNGVAVPGGGMDAVLVDRIGTNQYRVRAGTGCESTSWTPVGAGTYAGPVELTVPTQSGFENLIRTCVAGNNMRAYRGSIVVKDDARASANRAVVTNRVTTENYLRGVVPRESPDSWGSLGGGRGMEALKAQAVAARSYALAGGSRPSGAKTCDTISCQVYLGAAEVGWSGSAYVVTKTLDGPNSNIAIGATSGEVRRTAGGAIARTEFSSSTGGHTAGGAFPAVVDEGDDISSNPNHTWTTRMTAAQLAQRLKLPTGVGVSRIRVTKRSGAGDMGGRVTELTWVGTNGVTYRSAAGPEQDTIRSLLGLKSNWFTITGVQRGEAEKVVKALYQDVLGRGVDPSGLATWTDYVIRTESAWDLAERIVTSRERMNKLVAAQYRSALLREPEPGGLENWVRHLEAGRGVYDLMVGIYGSAESLQKLGGNDVGTWVGSMYEAILGRPAAAAEKEFWTDQARRRGRASVVASIASSDEAGMRRLTVYYQTFMQRGVDASGRATFLPMMTGRGDFDVPVRLGSSPEYWNRAQSRF